MKAKIELNDKNIDLVFRSLFDVEFEAEEEFITVDLDLTTLKSRKNFQENIRKPRNLEYKRLQNGEWYRYLYKNEELAFYTLNNPISGVFKNGEQKETGYCSHITISGKPEAVVDLINDIFEYGDVKGVTGIQKGISGIIEPHTDF